MANPPRTPCRTTEALVAASKHLHYELGMMDATARALASGAFGPGPASNAFLESFTIHARCLVHFFFSPSKPNDDDVVAEHFVRDQAEWLATRGDQPSVLVPVGRRVGKEVAHLTYQRQEVTPETKGWNYIAIREALVQVARTFIDLVPPERLDECWKRSATERTG